MHTRFLYVFIGLIGFLMPMVSQHTVEGVVFEDRNGDGIYQSGEKLLRDILMSDGDTIIKTGMKGSFSITAPKGSCVFPVLPGHYVFSGTGSIVSRAFLQIKSDSDKVLKHDFALTRTNDPTEFNADIVGDVQVKDQEELYFARKTIFSELLENDSKSFALFMGDLSNDNDSMLRQMRDCIDFLPFTSWNVVGNHDLSMTKPRNPGLFRELFGTDVFAFFKGQACFIALNNNDGFNGFVPPAQMRFIRQLMRLLPADVLPVICQHVPLYGVSNRDELLDAIGQRQCLILSGHAHNVSRHLWNEWVNEWVVGASCGSWWVGERDHDGIPVALQQDGAPRNYFKFCMQGTEYRLQFKGIGLDEDHQMDIMIKGQDVMDDSIPALAGLPDGYVVANIYAGGDSTRVEISVDEGKWVAMEHTEMVAPSVSRIIEWNRRKFYPTAYSRRIPLRARPSPHIWTYQLTPDDGSFHIIRIRASDRYGLGSIEQSRIYNLLKN